LMALGAETFLRVHSHSALRWYMDHATARSSL
jgi:hypothetical protein